MEILNDFKTSVIKAFDEIYPQWNSYSGLVIAGTHSPTKVELPLLIEKIKLARENKKPFLGICYGFQCAFIEWCINEINLKDASSTEIDPETIYPAVVKMKNRLTGIAPVTWFDNSITYESHWNGWAANPYYLQYFSPDIWDVSFGENCVEMIRIRQHPFFWGVQFHPEYESSKDKPHKLLVSFLETCKRYG